VLTGAKLLKFMGYPETASVVRQHVHLSRARSPGRLNEAVIVHYADKRVVDDRVSTLAERMDDVRRRYCRTPESLIWLEKWATAAFDLEREIFAALPGDPEKLLELNDKREALHP
jgi:hypothetical protein